MYTNKTHNEVLNQYCAQHKSTHTQHLLKVYQTLNYEKLNSA